MNRIGFIGSSDISVILGLNPFKTMLQLWAEKTGVVKPKDLSDNEAVEWGTRLERVVKRQSRASCSAVQPSCSGSGGEMIR